MYPSFPGICIRWPTSKCSYGASPGLSSSFRLSIHTNDGFLDVIGRKIPRRWLSEGRLSNPPFDKRAN